MYKVRIGLTSREGDQLGHLVRGVQMLRSFGHEFEVERYSNLLSVDVEGISTAAVCCFLDGKSAATLEALLSICSETEWALGDQPATLQVWLVHVDGSPVESAPETLLQAERQQAGRRLHMAAEEFRKICDWGQAMPDSKSDVIGEWPSASGR